MADKKQVKIEKRKYNKPEVTEVRLVAGEAVLGFCKTGVVGGLSLCNSMGDPQCGSDTGRS